LSFEVNVILGIRKHYWQLIFKHILLSELPPRPLLEILARELRRRLVPIINATSFLIARTLFPQWSSFHLIDRVLDCSTLIWSENMEQKIGFMLLTWTIFLVCWSRSVLCYRHELISWYVVWHSDLSWALSLYIINIS
jgi:hypothetical protein